MKKEIWIQVTSYRPNSDAPANRIFALSKFFFLKGYTINIITIGKETHIEQGEFGKVFYLKNKFHFKKKTLINRFFDNLCFLKGTKKIIKKNKTNIKNAFFISSIPEYISGLAGLTAKKYGSFLIVDIRDIWPKVAIEMGAFSQKSIFALFFNFIGNRLYKKCDLLTTVSKYKFDYFQTLNCGRYANKSLYIGNGFDLDILQTQPDFSLAKNIIPKNKFVISYVGNVGQAQNLSVLLDVSKQLDDTFLFLICGQGKELDLLKNKAHVIKTKNVVFTGQIPKEVALGITLCSNLCYVPLISEKMIDSVPTKLFESIGLGTPVLLLAEGESKQILIDSKLGLCLSPSKAGSLAEIIWYIKNNYTSFIKNKKHAMSYIKNNYSRQGFFELLYQALEKHLKETSCEN